MTPSNYSAATLESKQKSKREKALSISEKVAALTTVNKNKYSNILAPPSKIFSYKKSSFKQMGSNENEKLVA
jgi:hypothetical protein